MRVPGARSGAGGSCDARSRSRLDDDVGRRLTEGASRALDPAQHHRAQLLRFRERQRARPFLPRQRTGEQVDVVQPQQVVGVGVMRDAVDAGDDERMDGRWRERAGIEPRHRRRLGTDVLVREAVRVHQRVRDLQVDVEQIHHRARIGPPEPELRRDVLAGRLQLRLVTQPFEDRADAAGLVRPNQHVLVGAGPQRGVRVERVGERGALQEDRRDARADELVHDAPQLLFLVHGVRGLPATASSQRVAP